MPTANGARVTRPAFHLTSRDSLTHSTLRWRVCLGRLAGVGSPSAVAEGSDEVPAAGGASSSTSISLDRWDALLVNGIVTGPLDAVCLSSLTSVRETEAQSSVDYVSTVHHKTAKLDHFKTT